MCYTIHFSILMLCAKYQDAGLCGSREKCDRKYLLSKFAYVLNIQSSVKQEMDMPQVQKMRYTIQFSILMLCAKYQEAGLCGSPENCDRNYLVSKFAYVHNILSRVKQEVDKLQIQNCVTRYSSPY